MEQKQETLALDFMRAYVEYIENSIVEEVVKAKELVTEVDTWNYQQSKS